MQNKMNEIIDILKAGWCKGKFYDYNGNHCILGAFGKAGVSGHHSKEAEALKEAIAENYPEFTTPDGAVLVSWFNDDLRINKDDVIAVAEKAKVLLDSRIE